MMKNWTCACVLSVSGSANRGRNFQPPRKLETLLRSVVSMTGSMLLRTRGFQQHEASDPQIEAVRAKAIIVGDIQGLDLQLIATRKLQRVHGRKAIKCVVDAILTLARRTKHSGSTIKLKET